ncbi:hypothetical protein HUE87_12465 [Candidatus Sulfurimonas marisnigri]|uniref:WD40 repeat domain-containing protein n=1 Tax=Candidatus Sulfurimonas marisnigri TaxID=2740405 RepID=A0A7S7M0H0_9BACT|nr:hypothetical protein [Candidatus Sulfurimonas marisnigri]QOY54650.1 hypothetical protein HUE87_12465 [Candidatus Sulfurimonas marisnigri]
MSRIYECQISKSNITSLKVLDNNNFAYSTKLHGIILIDLNKCETKKNITNKYLNPSATAHSFSPNSKIFAFTNNHMIYVIDIETNETLQTIQTPDEDITMLSFDSSSTYIIAGTANGRVLQYRHNKTSLLARLCSFPHNRSSIYLNIKDNEIFVSAFAFHKKMFASAGYDGAIFIIDLFSHSDRKIITHNRTRVETLCFADENTLISGNSDGTIDITSLGNTKVHKTINTPLSTVKHIILMPNPDYIMVAGRTNIVTIIDIKKLKITHNKYLELSSNIVKIDIANGEYLVVAQENNKIVIIELPSIAKLKSLITHNSLEDAYKLILKEPMLQGSYEHKALEDKFRDDYLYATKALINQNKILAVNKLEIYKNIHSKQNEIKNLFEAFANFERFNSLFLENKYALAYSMSSRFPPLKLTPQYIKMEQIFKVAFSNAQRHIARGDIDGAKALLYGYNTVISKKQIIRLILTQNKEFIEFLEAVKNKDFININRLININALFTQIPNYLLLNDEIEDKLENIKYNINIGEIDTAKKFICALENIPSVSKKVQMLDIECKNLLLLQAAYEINNFKSCYEILDSHKSLAQTELAILLEKHWSKLMHQCEEYALNGNIKDIKKTLGNLIGLSTRNNKIGDLIRVSFHVRIKMLIQTKNFGGAETIIYTYIDIFGIDSEISQIMKKFEKISSIKLAISQNQSDRRSRNSWTHSDIIMKQEP